jgi:hypothetical protein
VRFDSLAGAFLPDASDAPVWSPDGNFIVLALRGPPRQLLILDARQPALARVVDTLPVGAGIRGWESAGSAAVSRLAISAESTVTVGHSIPVQLDAYAEGARRVAYPRGISWHLSDSSLARLDGGALTADRPGRLTVVASLGRAVADSMAILIRPPPQRLLLIEGFDGGLDTVRWRLFGYPTPVLVPRAGRSGSFAYDPAGDNSHSSGMVLRRRLDTVRGLTIEWWARFEPADNPWQELYVRLSDLPPDSFVSGRGTPVLGGPLHAVLAQAPQSGDPRPWTISLQAIGTGGGNAAIPPFLGDGHWHRFRLVLYPTGEVRWFADGRQLIRSTWIDLSGLPAATLEIAGRSHLSVALMDDVTVWEGVHLDPAPRQGQPRRNSLP